MGRVKFRGADGVEWRVCEVTREQLERRTPVDAARAAAGAGAVSRSVLPGLEQGWLSFESWWEKRRLPPPYPAGWQDLPTAELERLWTRATPVAPVPRRRDGGA